MAINQWVNLPTDEAKKSTFVEGKIEKAKRVGPKLLVKVEFEKGELADFKWKVKKVGGPAYDPAEVNNNPRFKGFFKGAGNNEGKAKVDDVLEVTLPVMGGAKYQVEVKHKDTVIGTKDIEARRRLYYKLFKMEHLKCSGGDLASVVSAVETLLWNPGKDYYIEALKKGEQTIPEVPTIDTSAGSGPSSTNTILRYVKHLYGDEFKKFTPVGIPIVIARSIAQPVERTFTKTVTLPKPVKLDSPINETIVLDLEGYPRHLWQDLVPADDRQNGGFGAWFVSGFLLVSESEKIHHICWLTPKQAMAFGEKSGTWGGYSKVRLFPDAEFLKRHAGKQADVSLTVKLASFKNGFSSGTHNVIVLATEGAWKQRTVDDLKQTLLHEIGHKIGMVANGSPGLPNKPNPSHYYGFKQYGHQGKHCKNGMKYKNGVWSGTAKCVMFGASVSGRSGDFCGDCAKTVPKLDVSGDWFRTPLG